ncbi:MAG TPA: hypothetical protein PLZ10_12655, partial [Chitinophagaceae bacterium]|nr:hypothetical protein [Chitinophagaceae bacterium]
MSKDAKTQGHVKRKKNLNYILYTELQERDLSVPLRPRFFAVKSLSPTKKADTLVCFLKKYLIDYTASASIFFCTFFLSSSFKITLRMRM